MPAFIVNPINGTAATAFQPSDVSGILTKFAQEIITGASIIQKYPMFERTVEQWGGILGDIRVPPAARQAVDPNTTAICGPYYFQNDAVYYDTWQEDFYPSEYRRVELSKVFNGEMAFNDFIQRVLQRNIEGFRADVNAAIVNALCSQQNQSGAIPARLIGYNNTSTTLSAAITNSSGWLNDDRTEVLDSPTWDDLFSEIGHIARDMTFSNLDYIGKARSTDPNPTVASKNTIGFGNEMTDLIICMPEKLYSYADMSYIQRLENLIGLNKLPEIVLYDGSISYTGGEGFAVIIMDKRVLNHVTRYQEVLNNDIACRASTQLILHVNHMYKYMPYYKAFAIVTPMPESSTSTRNIAAALYTSQTLSRIPISVADSAYRARTALNSIDDNVDTLEASVNGANQALNLLNTKVPGNLATEIDSIYQDVGDTATAAITIQQDVAAIKTSTASIDSKTPSA